MNGRSKRKHSIDMLFPVTLFFIFAFLAVMILVFAANIYSSNTQKEQAAEKKYTPVLYITEKVRQNDGQVTVEKVADSDALVLHSYSTYIYYYDGYLRELFVEDGIKINPKAGQEIMETGDFKAELDSNKVIKFEVINEDVSTGYIYTDN